MLPIPARPGQVFRQVSLVECLAGWGAPGRGLAAAPAADILWAINHPTVWQLLAGERGWTPEQYEEWSAAAACRELLTPETVR